MIMTTDKTDVQALIRTKRRRLQKLKERQAARGIDAPIEIETEIEDIEDELVDLEDQLAEILVQEELAAAPVVYIANLNTLPAPGQLPSGARVIDWSDQFTAQPRAVPPPEVWQEVLWPELAALPTQIGQTGLIRLQGTGALSTAFAFGQVFKQIGRYRLAVDQYSPTGTEVWYADAPPEAGGAAPQFVSHIAMGEMPGQAGLVIMYAAPQTGLRNMVSEVGSYWGESEGLENILEQAYTPQRCSGVLVLEAPPASRGQHLAGWQTAALALSSRRQLNEFVNQCQPDRLHLFMAGPVALAAFVGHYWNQVGLEIQCYERLGQNQYTPSLTI